MGRLTVIISSLLVAGCTAKPAAVVQGWDGSFAEPVVRPEHPRPDFFRDTFINLNTVWEFAFDPADEGLAAQWFEREDVWDAQIQVPYAWEAPLSGLGTIPEMYSIVHTAAATTYRGVGWYRLQLPEVLPPGDDWHLVFGAVDFEATVWVDGAEVGSHRGGYAPFSVNLSAATSGQTPPTIVVRVEDQTELNDRAQPVGKQGGVWYTRVSGIWQTVYLEQRPPTHLVGVRVVPRIESGAVDVTLEYAGAAEVRVEASLDGVVMGEASAVGTAATLTVPLEQVALWDVGTPTLYDLTVTVSSNGRDDVVHSYFGLSTAGTDWMPGRSPAEQSDALQQAKSFIFNGAPVYPRCVLDQSYWPDGIYTAPSLDHIRADLQLAKDLGFNCVRLHIKPDEPAKYRLIDEMGLYLVYDLPNLDMETKNTEGFVGRAHFAQTQEAVMRRDRNHPSLLSWVVFNENWGLSTNGSLLSPTPLQGATEMQGWVREMVALARELDPTRPVEDNSAGGSVGVFEHLDTDVNSFHHYDDDAASWRALLEAEAAVTFPGSAANYVGGGAQDGAPWWNSEFASFSAFGGSDDVFCGLFGSLNELRRRPRLTGWVLTQLTDVEYEHNGLVTYDRATKEDMCARHGVGLADVIGDDFVGFEWLPGEALTAGATVQVPLWFSQWSSGESRGRTLRLRWGDGETEAAADFESAPYEVESVDGITVTAPIEAGAHVLVAEVFDGDVRVCANRISVIVSG